MAPSSMDRRMADLADTSLFGDSPPDRGAQGAPSLAGASGILPDRSIRTLVQRKMVQAVDPIDASQIQPASLDLRLARRGYRIRASFIPREGQSVRQRAGALIDHEFDLAAGAVLERDCVYLVELKECLNLTDSLSAIANPKSTTGRIDVFTRLIADGAEVFDQVPVAYRGPLFAEISPRKFSIKVREGSRLSQLRFIRRNPTQLHSQRFQLSDRELIELDRTLRADGPSGLVDGQASIRDGLQLGVSLAALGEDRIVGYRARHYAPPIDVDLVGHYRIADYWEPIREESPRSLILDPHEFYILASREALHIPPDYAAEMVPIDPAMGEFRVHYAGFFDPGFGHSPAGGAGSRAVLEVRSLDIPFMLEDGQVVARLKYERLAEPVARLYGSEVGSTYQAQGLKLSKHFHAG